MQLYSSNLENITFPESNTAGKGIFIVLYFIDYSKKKEKRDSYNSTDDE